MDLGCRPNMQAVPHIPTQGGTVNCSRRPRINCAAHHYIVLVERSFALTDLS